jgi:hypothetical protein
LRIWPPEVIDRLAVSIADLPHIIVFIEPIRKPVLDAVLLIGPVVFG